MAEPSNLVEEQHLLRAAYRDFNARRLDAVLMRLHPNVEWANGMEGGHVFGREGVRAYWTLQWATIDPHVEPLAIHLNDQGGLTVEVHQVVRDLSGVILVDTTVHHVYRFADQLIQRMDIA